MMAESAQKKDLTVVIPAYDERESLAELLRRLDAVIQPLGLSYEIIVIDDGSNDGSSELLRELRGTHPALRYVEFQRNFGKSAALAVGFARARGDVVITMDADLQDDPAEIPSLMAKLDEGFDLVSGWKKERKDPFIKNSTSKLFNLVTSMSAGLRLHDFNCGLKAYRREVTESLRVYGEMHRYLPLLAHVMGFRVTEIPVRHQPRQFGETKFGRSRFLNGMLDLFTVLFLTRQRSSPLHFFGRVGLAFGTLGSGICLYFFWVWIDAGALRLRPLLLLGIALILVALQFISLGLLAELFVASRDNQSHIQIRSEG
jgi:glycosyltransferase involved in cell wall biosynthesis